MIEILAAVFAASAFGNWQNSLPAGMFMFFTLLLVALLFESGS